MALFQKYNNENIHSRAVIAGLLNILNNHIEYEQVWSNEEIESVKVPWFYNQSGDERFMQDFYTFYGWCLPPRPVDGNFDRIPRGAITYTGSQINAQRITSRFVQGRFLKEIDGKLQSYISMLYSIPLSMTYDCEMWIDNHLTALKLEQLIRELFYKTITFYVYYKGMRLGCQVGFPESYTLTKNIQYSFESDNKIKLNFQLEVEAYQPVFDKTTETLAEKNIKAFAYRLYDAPNKYDGDISVISPLENVIIPKGIPLSIEWLYSREEAVINKVDISYTYFNQNTRYSIDKAQPNHEMYIWNIPDNFTEYKQPEIIWEETDNITIIRQPSIKIIPDLNTKQITSSSFYVIDGGYFYVAGDPSSGDASIGITLEMRDTNNNVMYTENDALILNIKFNKLNELNLINTLDPSLYFPGNIDYKYINIYVSNSVNADHFGITHGIKIV